jgi:hypothetical protein
MTIDDMHKMILWIKNQYQSGDQSPEQMDSAINAAITNRFNENKRMFEASGYISDSLAPFKTFANVTITSGFGNKPSNYAYRTNAEYAGVEVEIVPESEWVNRKNDPVDVPSATYPICAIREQIEVYPTGLTPLKLYYLRKPATVVWAYTSSGDDLIYDSGNSVDCDFPEDCHVDIICRACVFLGLPLDQDMMVRLKAYEKQTENV